MPPEEFEVFYCNTFLDESWGTVKRGRVIQCCCFWDTRVGLALFVQYVIPELFQLELGHCRDCGE